MTRLTRPTRPTRRRTALRPARTRDAATALLAMLCLLGSGCLVTDERLADELVLDTTAREASAPLGGEALSQRKRQLDSTYRDLTHFHATLESLNHRGDRSGQVRFSEFLETYVVKHVMPLLAGEWQSRHPEVAVLDVNVRLAVAELWVQMNAGSAADRMLDEIERRYAGREQMLVAYPIGSKGTLGEGLERLRNRDWWSG